jgi:cyanate permease
VNPVALVTSSVARTIPAVILAHQGGWDEALLVATPLVLIGLLLWVANRRVTAQLAAAAADKDAEDDATDETPRTSS